MSSLPAPSLTSHMQRPAVSHVCCVHVSSAGERGPEAAEAAAGGQAGVAEEEGRVPEGPGAAARRPEEAGQRQGGAAAAAGQDGQRPSIRGPCRARSRPVRGALSFTCPFFPSRGRRPPPRMNPSSPAAPWSWARRSPAPPTPPCPDCSPRAPGPKGRASTLSPPPPSRPRPVKAPPRCPKVCCSWPRTGAKRERRKRRAKEGARRQQVERQWHGWLGARLRGLLGHHPAEPRSSLPVWAPG